MRIDRRDHKPLFAQIGDAIRRQIESGDLKRGDAIPSEREYAEELGVSRMTVRAALDALVREGLLLRQRGRSTVVSAAKINRSALGFMSFTEDMKTRGLLATSRVLQLSAEVADATVAAQLGLPVGARVVFLERVRLADDEPMALERAYLPHQRFGGLLGQDLAQHSLYDVLEHTFGCRPSLADESVEAILLNAADARLLGVPRNSPALLARRITRDERGEPVESVQTLYRADRYRMVFTRKR